MARLASLPEEVLIMILKSIDSLSQLAECRTVCKTWCCPAEKIMLGREIFITSERGIFRLYDIIVRNPAKGYLIKHLKFDICEPQQSLVLTELLYLAITPNIESMTGVVEPYAPFYTTMTDIVQNSTMKLDKLKSIPHPVVTRTNNFNLLLHFKDTLQTMVLQRPDESLNSTFFDFVEALESFKSLTFLTLEGRFGSVEETNMVLDKCPYLQNLTLNIQGEDIVQFTDHINAWTESSVDKQHNLKMLTIKSECPPDLVEYLLYKYTSIDKIVIDVDLEDDFFENSFHRIVTVINKVPQKELFLTIPSEDDIKDLIRNLNMRQFFIATINLNDDDDIRVKIEGL